MVNPLFLQEIQAGLFTTLTRLGADRTMFHVRRVLSTLRRAYAARHRTGAQLCPDQFAVCRGDPGDHPCGREANICAIQIHADAGHLAGDAAFPETGIGAGVAGFRAGIARRDALHRAGMIRCRIKRVRLEHLLDITHAGYSRPAGGARLSRRPIAPHRLPRFRKRLFPTRISPLLWTPLEWLASAKFMLPLRIHRRHGIE
jgi:hypothetical protein